MIKRWKQKPAALACSFSSEIKDSIPLESPWQTSVAENFVYVKRCTYNGLTIASRFQDLIPQTHNCSTTVPTIFKCYHYSIVKFIHILLSSTLNNIHLSNIKISTGGSSFCSMSSYLLNIHCQNCMHSQIIRYILIALTGQYQVYYIMQNCLITKGKMPVPQKSNFQVITFPRDHSYTEHLQK